MERRQQPVSRRRLLALAAGGLLVAACGKAEVVSRRGKPEPASEPAPPPPEPTPAPQPLAGPEARPGLSPAAPVGGGPLVVPKPSLPGVAGPQNLVMPVLPQRAGHYATRLAPPERLIIPAIELDAKVIPIGTRLDKEGRLVWETAPFAVGHHRGTGMPGEPGNVVLSGHISSRSEGAVFSRLPQVKPGDGIVIATAERYHLYRVVETTVVTPDQVEVIDRTDVAVATLLTCVPDGVYTHRLVVRAEAV